MSGSLKQINTPKPDDQEFTCYFDSKLMILPIEVKSKFYLKGFDEQLLFPEIYKSNEKARLSILGRGSGKTLLCEYHEDTIALKLIEQQRTRGICAFKAIHDKGVLHSDIREENILLAGDDVYIIDF
ncbi:hypothetical protein RhiirA4_455232 [Rhizophagus irregularis]|uniref:Protein kinase domain-containing protein n=1 Tax=Rhizophagus irregularis TaxID=588596 RepID=A0A2I1G4Q9_9GLOM|nr:hypothetical protein RhiirA4_455232 [Rhizophagus irregularis]